MGKDDSDTEISMLSYGEGIAPWYDKFTGEPPGFGACLDILSELAGDGPALELGIGTGRVAIPLAERGVSVTGIELSPAMIAELRRKPGSDKLRVIEGNFAKFSMPDEFSLVYCVYVTFESLLTQADQISCFRAIGEALMPDGSLVLEMRTVDTSIFDRGQRMHVFRIGERHLTFTASMYDALSQVVTVQRVVIDDGELRTFPMRHRMSTVSEIDLLAEIGGLRLVERYSSWDRAPFAGDSPFHISVFKRR